MITKNTRIIPELDFLYLRLDSWKATNGVLYKKKHRRHIQCDIPVQGMCYFLGGGISCNRAIKKKIFPFNSARRYLGSSLRPGGPWLSLKLHQAAVHSRRVRLESGAGAGSNCSQSRPEIICSQPPRRKCGLELLWRFEKWKEMGTQVTQPASPTSFWVYQLSIRREDNNQMKNISRGEPQRSVSGCAGQWELGFLFSKGMKES